MGTRRGRQEGTIRKRANRKLWEGRITLDNGRRKSFYGTTRKEVQDKIKRAQQDKERGLDLGARNRSLSAFLDEWLGIVGPKLRPKSRHSYAQMVRLHIKPAIGRIQLGKLTTGQVQKMLTEMGEREGRKQTVAYVRNGKTITYTKAAGKLSPRTIAYTRDILRSALNDAIERGLLVRNVATFANPPRQQRNPVKPLSVDQANDLIDRMTEGAHPLLPLVATAIYTGMRRAELMGLRWRDVDLATGVIHVRHALQRVDGEWRFVEPKSKRSVRTLSLPDRCVEVLTAHKDRQTFHRRSIGNMWHDLDLVFATDIGTPLEPSNINKRLHKLFDDHGLTRQGLHSLRHCCASVLLGEGVSARIVMEQLGHSQFSLTMDTYSHVMPAMLKEAAQKMDDAFARAKKRSS